MGLVIPISFLFDIAAFAALYAIVALSLNLQFGLAGIANFGLVLGVATGAFTVGGLSGRLAQWILNVMPGADFVQQNSPIMGQVNTLIRQGPALGFGIMAFTLILAMLLGAAIGYLSSLPSIRLRTDYLAITLLAFGETIRVVGDRYDPIVGGALGITLVDPFGFLEVWRFHAITVFIVILAAIVFVYGQRVERSPMGRVLRAVRDNDLSAQTLGKDIANIRKRAVTVGTAIAALAGALYAFYTVGVTAMTYTRVDWVFWPWVMVIIGGAGNSRGAVFGATSVIVVRAIINLSKRSLTQYVFFDPTWIEYLAFGLALLIILTYRPKGIIPERIGGTVEEKAITRPAKGSEVPK